MKVKHSINLSKATTFIFILALMVAYQNFSLVTWVYLSLHGTYGILWLLKDRIYPDKQWEQEVPVVQGIIIFGIVCLYWVAPHKTEVRRKKEEGRRKILRCLSCKLLIYQLQ
ncbi:hypothetical protein [Okeania sp. SIO1I7]|uniref:hypothetical protein n=1 Tax=Okeania sp. SIO1I7 TaxID=2607772 RepID=UPI0025EC6E77|nr:hypothetical protein [Okeania sp. SIO1I7]